MFIETSAKAGVNVKALFRKVAAALLDNNAIQPSKSANELIDVNLQPNSETKDQTQAGCGWC